MSESSAGAPRARTHPALAERRRAVARARGRRRRSLAVIGLGTLAAIAALYWLATGPLAAVHGVAVTGYDRPDRAELVQALTAAAGEGTILRPATGAMERAASDFPWVESITVVRRWPRALSVRVVPAEPAAVAAFEDQAVLVSPEGRVLGVKDGPAGVGWLRLAAAPPATGGRLPADALAPLHFVAAAPPAAAARVRALHLTARGLVEGRITDGPELLLGSPERMPAKAEALGLLLESLSPEEEAAASYIDLTVPENPALGPAS